MGFCSCDQLLINLTCGTVVLDKQMHIGWQKHWAEIVFSFIFICRPTEQQHDQGLLATQQHEEEWEERGKVRKPKRPRKGI